MLQGLFAVPLLFVHQAGGVVAQGLLTILVRFGRFVLGNERLWLVVEFDRFERFVLGGRDDAGQGQDEEQGSGAAYGDRREQFKKGAVHESNLPSRDEGQRNSGLGAVHFRKPAEIMHPRN